MTAVYLLIAVMGFGSPLTETTVQQEFDSLETCQDADRWLVADAQANARRYSLPGFFILTHGCYRK